MERQSEEDLLCKDIFDLALCEFVNFSGMASLNIGVCQAADCVIVLSQFLLTKRKQDRRYFTFFISALALLSAILGTKLSLYI